MIRSYFLVALRNMSRYRLFSLINITGLGIGITAAIILGLFAKYQLSYDQFHQKQDRIFLVYKERITPAGLQPTYDTWMPLLPQLKMDFPEVENGARVLDDGVLVEVDGKRFNERCYYTDPEYFSLFDFKLDQGQAQLLHDEKSVFLSKRLAEKFFGSGDPVGKVIRVDFTREYRVAGVLAESPKNAFFTSELILPLRSMPDFKEEETNWGSSSYFTFVLLRDGARISALTDKFPDLIKKIWDEETQRRTNFRVLPMKDTFRTFVGDPNDVYILIAVGLGLVLIASINFVNLSTAKSLDRNKEVSMRKIFGAQRIQLMNQFLSESVILSLGALLFALAASRLVLPFINSQFNLDLHLDFSNPLWMGGLVLFSVVLGFVAGLFPSIVLSGLHIQRGLKTFTSSRSYLRNGLVALQFTLSIVLVVTMMTIGKQIDFMRTANLGFRTSGMMVLPISVFDFPNADEAQARLKSFKDILAGHSGVQSLTSSRHIPTQWSGSNTFVKPEGWTDDPLRMRFTYFDSDFLNTYEIQLLEGDGFKDDSFGDQRESVLINEAALRAFGWKDVRDKYIMLGDNRLAVVGLIQDFNYETLREEVAPIIHMHRVASNRTHRYITVHVSRGQEQAVLDFAKSKWGVLDESGQLPFNYFWLDENLDTMYQAEQRLFTMIRIFSMVILVVACMGLFGLASFSIEKRKKEIGIRKILGASVLGIVLKFFGGYLRLLLISFALALPLSWYLMGEWLAGYARHTSPGVLTFAVALAVVAIVVISTVSIRTITVALQNPVNVIREE